MMNEVIKEAKESLKSIHTDIEEGMDKKFIDIDFGLILNTLIKPIGTALNQADETDRALKIIISKCVDIWVFYRFKDITLKMYNDCARDSYRKLTQEEFDLVKRMVNEYGK